MELISLWKFCGFGKQSQIADLALLIENLKQNMRFGSALLRKVGKVKFPHDAMQRERCGQFRRNQLKQIESYN